MGKNKFESFVFSITVCFLMVTGMTLYNATIVDAEATNIPATTLALQFLIIFCVAFVIDWFLVAPVVKKIVAKATNQKTPFFKKVMMISGLMVLFMCAAMSLVAMLLHGYHGAFWNSYANTFVTNFIFALPLQFFVVGPIARTAFMKMFPAPMPVAN